MRLHFVDTNEAFISIVQELFGDEADATCCDVASVPGVTEGGRLAFVSPANSLGFMDGGIDARYMTMFPDVQTRVRSKIRELGKVTMLGRPYLPVGSAISTSVGTQTWLISAPTMFLPHDVSSTRNAYLAMTAALRCAESLEIDTLVVPAMCTGYGKMPIATAAEQQFRAWREFVADPRQPSGAAVYEGGNHDNEQPVNFDTREIQGDQAFLSAQGSSTA
jgi:O-acetyl-ADP-ribose deacetylase (regulator of RNase III)